MANPAVVVDFVANTRDLQRGFSEAGSKASRFGSKIKGLALGAATAGFAALAGTLKTGVDEFTESQKVAAQTESVLKSTGKAAGVTAGHVSDLAGAIMKKTGVDDEAIQSGENLLLTFTNVRNEAGKGNDIFDQATQTITDMSVALGTDMKGSAIQLGKALNNPIQGVGALAEVGVSFTDAQKKSIEQMQKHGDMAGAQTVILQELKKEFGGSAEAAGKTLPGQLNILKQQFSNLAGELVAKMIPPLTTVTKLLLEHKTAVIVVAGVLAGLVVTVLAVNAAIAIWNALQLVASGATKAWAAAQWLINVALTANPIGIVVVAIAALIAALIVAYKTSDTFREIVDAAFGAVLGIAKTLFNWLKANWPLLLAILTGPIGLAVLAITRNWDTIKDTVATGVNAVKTTITNAWNAVKTATTGAWATVSAAVSDVIGAIKTLLSGLATWLGGFAAGVLSTAVARVKAVWDNIADGAREAVSAVKGALNGLIDWLGGLVERIAAAAGRIANAIKAPINAVIDRWNTLSFTIPKITIPSIKIGKKRIGGGTIGGQTIDFPDIPRLARGGVLDSPTLALVGEQGREIVTPEKLLRDIVGRQAVEVHVYIGETELKGLVRTEIVDANTGLARTLLAGGA